MNSVLHVNIDSLDEAFVKDLKRQYGSAEVEISIQKLPEDWLTGEQFWKVIDQLDWTKDGDQEAVAAPAISGLAALSVGNIHQFQDILSEKLWLLDTFAHAKVFMDAHPKGRLSVDDFLYVRCAVVAKGAVFFNEILKTPASIPQDVTFEPLLTLASNAYEMKTGRPFVHAPAFDFETYGNEKGWA